MTTVHEPITATDAATTAVDLSVWPASTTDGYAAHAITRILDQPQLELSGLHCRLGSRITGVTPCLVAVPVAGACHLSMASCYDLVGRPPVVAVRDGQARLLVRRESLEDIRRSDVGL